MSPISSPGAFREEARYQRCCQIKSCGSTGAWQPHHVLDKQWLKREKLPQNDPRNAMRLCTRCHMQHEWAGPGKVDIALTDLPEDAICYVFETMGDGPASVYLMRHYTGSDPRVDAHINGECVPCRQAA